MEQTVDVEEIKLLESLSAEEVAKLTERATTRNYKKNSLIMNEGDESDSLYIIESGKVKIFVSDEDGKEFTLNLLGPGDYFGELALIDGGPRSSSAITTEESKLLIIHKPYFEQFLKQHPEVSLRIIQGMSRLLRQLTDKSRGLALMTVYERVALTLLRMAEPVDGVMTIKPKITHADLASMVGCRREMVSRIMSDLSKGEYIQTTDNATRLLKKLPARW
ncbi:MAG: Crp/Fnr family transcriptional regulator [Gammaproteobacteria bacterium]|nr:Crp/Fnr family transcriptional regulator [Gammaproteobacteria bacterium]